MIFNRGILNVLFFVVAFAFLAWLFSDIVLYLVLSFVLAGILRTPTNYLSQVHFFGARVPRAIAILISFTILAGVIALFALLFVPLVQEQISVIASLDYNDLFDRAVSPLKSLEKMLIKNKLTTDKEGFIVKELKDRILAFVSTFRVGELISDLIFISGNFFVALLAVLFITFFLLFERGKIRKNLIALIPNKYFEFSISTIYKVEKLLSNYLLGLMLQLFSIFTIIAFGLIMAGVKYAITIAAFAALAHLVPFIGALAGAIFALSVGISTADPELLEGGGMAFIIIKIMVVFGVAYLSDNVFLQPIIFSRSVKAHPLEIFLVIFAGATLAGAIGMVAAIPAYTILRVSFIEFRKAYSQYKIFNSGK